MNEEERIEKLMALLAKRDSEIARLNAYLEIRGDTIEKALDTNHKLEAEIGSLRDRFFESQQREKAAVEDMRNIYEHDCDLCRVCKHDDGRGDTKFYNPDTMTEYCKKCNHGYVGNASNFEWRGPQDEKGEKE